MVAGFACLQEAAADSSGHGVITQRKQTKSALKAAHLSQTTNHWQTLALLRARLRWQRDPSRAWVAGMDQSTNPNQ